VPRKCVLSFLLAAALAVLVACTPQVAPETEAIEPESTGLFEGSGTIVLADISDEPAEIMARFQPLADYLAANLSAFGINVGEVKVAPNMGTMADWLASGEVDLYFGNSYPALIVSEKSGALPVLRGWKGGSGEVHSVFFARADSGLTSLADLKSHMVAFGEPNSTSGYLLPMAHLVQAGLIPIEKSGPDSNVSPIEVGYVYSGEAENTFKWVCDGTVIAGVTDNHRYKRIAAQSDVELTILAETEALPRQMVLVRPGLDAELLAAVEALLLGLHESEEGLEVLEIFKTTKFDEFPQGADAALDRMRRLYDLVQSTH
jgi:phosphonate transport system substrate-binding protein